uniref:Uncharacterized protein n=1 Tax=Oryza glumipatula TaxID=40148 RepID=A0A0E0AGY6_9ORYZ
MPLDKSFYERYSSCSPGGMLPDNLLPVPTNRRDVVPQIQAQTATPTAATWRVAVTLGGAEKQADYRCERTCSPRPCDRGGDQPQWGTLHS